MFGVEQRHKIAEARYNDFERNRIFEEKTDLAERVGYPIHTDIYYDLNDNGSLYCRTDTKKRAFIDQTFQAKQEAGYVFVGDQSFEVTRRSHEHDEALMVESLARGELDGNVLVKVSKVPDSVVEGKTSISGYRRDNLRSFIRIYEKQNNVIRCKLLSIDGNDHNGLVELSKYLGMKIVGRSSEDILADSVLYNVPESSDDFVESLASKLVSVYDEAIYKKTDNKTYAGSKFLNHIDAQSAVDEQPGLISQHLEAISRIASLSINFNDKENLYEKQRQATAAAISLATRGYIIESTNDAVVAIELKEGDYSRDCATANNAMQQGESKQFDDWKDRKVESCPMCGTKKVTASKSGEIISGSCGCHLNVCTGKYWRDKPTIKPEVTGPVIHRSEAGRMSKQQFISRNFGKHAVHKTRLVAGGAVDQIIDRKTGQIIDEIVIKKKDLSLVI